MNNNGDQPLTQVTRDNMAQNDHDKLVEYGVMLQNIAAGQLRLETQIKDLIQGQVAALASWEDTSQAVHTAQDVRIRKIEEQLLSTKSAFLGGWKTIIVIGAFILGVGSLTISIIGLFHH